MRSLLLLGFFASSLVVVPVAGQAVTTAFDDRAAFLAAVGGDVSVLDFDGEAPGTSIPSGTALGGITFVYDIAGLDMAVTDVFDTTSPANSLGLDDPGNFDQFIAGDAFDLVFAEPVVAVGLSFVTGDPLLEGDVALVTEAGSVTNTASVEDVLGDGGLVYFVGLVSDTAFTELAVRFDPAAAGAFLFNVDDITTAAGAAAVPEPGAGVLFAVGVLLVTRRSWRQSP